MFARTDKHNDWLSRQARRQLIKAVVISLEFCAVGFAILFWLAGGVK